jgi:hypothetical protein
MVDLRVGRAVDLRVGRAVDLRVVLLPEWREKGVLPVVVLLRRGRDSKGSQAFPIVDFYLIDGRVKLREAAANPEEFFVAPGAAEELRPLCRPLCKHLP